MPEERQPQPKPRPQEQPCRHRTLTPDGKRCADCHAKIYL
ncbi:NapC/NirT family cytochrome c [Streptomyces sulphureus]|nr:NapC/NirT family cytochrome c [Streptomyces sulphureus]